MSKLSRVDFDRFLKNFSFKCFELFLQSRDGNKQHTHSAANPHIASWFNLAIEGVDSVKDEIKSSPHSLMPTPDKAIGLEVFADMDDQRLSIEIWSIHLLADNLDISATNVYNHISILLRSVLVATRTTPSYVLARQGDQTKLRHAFITGPLDYSGLGRDMVEKEVAHTCTPYGKIIVRLAYRTSLILTQDMSTLDSFIQNGLTALPERPFDPENEDNIKGVFGYEDTPLQQSLSLQLQGPFAALGELQPMTLNMPDIPLEESILSASSGFSFPNRSPSEKTDCKLEEEIKPMFYEDPTGSYHMYNVIFNPPHIKFKEDAVTVEKAMEFLNSELPELDKIIAECKLLANSEI
eukprot:TRINITY_DN6948_c0_g1_i1.p1 TRINITY_DN6948_c0_g1~~TRINITY_DN6948_c0_g1_i1.p1  ORF type:complete len:352 (-),score=65.03 TRINITY_DN6948_c0_g1_i1:43-1098(-)